MPRHHPSLKAQLETWISRQTKHFTLRKAAEFYDSIGGRSDWLTIARIVGNYGRQTTPSFMVGGLVMSGMKFGVRRIEEGPRGGRWSPDSVWQTT